MSVLLAFSLISTEPTLLSQARNIASTYSSEVAKSPPPNLKSLPSKALDNGSVWFLINKEKSALFFKDPSNWSLLRDLGTESIQIENISKNGSLGIDPSFEGEFQKYSCFARDVSINFIGYVIGKGSAIGEDFRKALKNEPAYQNLYQLIEIPKEDWHLLPNVPNGSEMTNVPWLNLQALHSKGYVPQQFTPYVKETNWNATNETLGEDGTSRRWIYLKEKGGSPVFDFLSPTYSAFQILSADALSWCKQAGTKLLKIDGSLPLQAQNMLSLWIRKIGGYSASLTDGSIEALATTPTDLTYDIATQGALLHALLTQDARALQMIYKMLLNAQIECRRLVHVLQAFDNHQTSWRELTKNSKQKFLYCDEQITGELLKKRLLREDLQALGMDPRSEPITWLEICGRRLNIVDFEKEKEKLLKAHLLLAFTYGLQPGAFSFSYDDLLGALPETSEGPKYLYGDLKVQMKNPHSFARELQKILCTRSSTHISHGDLIDVLPSPNRGTLLLLFRLPITRNLQLLAVNFSENNVVESIEKSALIKTNAKDLMTDLMEEKIFSSANFSFTLSPMSGRAFLFQAREYE